MTSLALAGPGDVLPLAAAAVGLLMFALWAVSLRIKDVSIVDPAWGPAFVVVAVVAFLAGDGDEGRRGLLLALTGAWGLRLGVHLLRRKLGEIGEEDKRYAQMRARRGEGSFACYSLGVIFGFQALLGSSCRSRSRSSRTAPPASRCSCSRVSYSGPSGSTSRPSATRSSIASRPIPPPRGR